MTLTADSGSTKTTWRVSEGQHSLLFHTQGINPFHLSEKDIEHVITQELLASSGFPSAGAISEVHFFGAGCTKDKAPVVRRILQTTFTQAMEIEVDSDMLGAARALFDNQEGIACILGTGANSCLYDGRKIVSNVSPMGYILGDEGSGAVLGRTFINLLYKGGHSSLIPVFEQEMQLTLPDIIEKVYREPMANRFLASVSPFIKAHLDEEWIERMVTECFQDFFRHNTAHYNRPDLPCAFVGSIAYHFEPQLRTAAKREGSFIIKVMKEPLV